MRPHPVLLAIAVTALLLPGCKKSGTESAAGDKPGGKVEWRVASSFSSTLPVLGAAGTRVAQRLEALSGGRIKLQVFEPGKLVAPSDVFDAVGKGTVDAGLSMPNAWFDRMPAVAFFGSPPFGADSVEYLAWLYQGQGLELWRELYGNHNVVPVPCGYVPPEGSGWFRKPITSADDFKGLKIHMFGLGGLVLQKLGAQVLVLSAEDIYPALERGVLDAAQVSIPSIDEKLGLAKVAKHYYFPGWQQQASVLTLLVNKDRWNALAATDRELIDVVCRDTLVFNMTHGEVQQSQAIQDLKKQGVQVHYWSPQQLQLFRNAYDSVVKEMRIKDADFKRVDDAYQKFRDSYAEWGQLSRLPSGF
ncbi:MAG TPA: TRAP transporter substrate-binding protein [bacterium]|nr:TRAP transporter substrate-binding protein [bacterium]